MSDKNEWGNSIANTASKQLYGNGYLAVYQLVAGAGLEPVTFGL